MAKSFTSLSDTYSQHIGNHNNLVNQVGDLDGLVGGDSDLVSAINAAGSVDSAEVNILIDARIDSSSFVHINQSDVITSDKAFRNTTIAKNMLYVDSSLNDAISGWKTDINDSGSFTISTLDSNLSEINQAYNITRDSSNGSISHKFNIKDRNVVTIDSDGLNTSEIIQENGVPINPIGTHSISIPGAAFRPYSGTVVEDSDFFNTGINFPTSFGTTSADFGFMMPSSWDRGDVSVKLTWKSKNPALLQTGGVVWGAACYSVGDGDSIDSLNFPAISSIVDSHQNVGILHKTDEITGVSVAGSTDKNDLMVLRIYRLGLDPLDDFNYEALLLSANLNITTVDAVDS